MVQCQDVRSQIGYGSQNLDPHFLKLIQQVGYSLTVGNPGTPDLVLFPWLRPATGRARRFGGMLI